MWNLLNFYTYVKSYIKSTKGFIQRKMRSRLEHLVKILHQADLDEDDPPKQVQGCGWKMKPISSSRFRKLRKQYGGFKRKIKRVRYRIRIHGFSELNNKIKRIHHQIKTHDFSLRRNWFSTTTTKFHSTNRYTRLE